MGNYDSGGLTDADNRALDWQRIEQLAWECAAHAYDAETARLIEKHRMHINEPGEYWFAGYKGRDNWHTGATLGEAVRKAVGGG